jgi:hypothetical protein
MPCQSWFFKKFAFAEGSVYTYIASLEIFLSDFPSNHVALTLKW